MENTQIDTESRIIDTLLTQRGTIDESVLMEFARWCALQAAGLWEVPAIVREYLKTGNESLREAAHQAAVEHPIPDVVTAWAVEAARQATGGEPMSPEYRAYYAAYYAAMAIVHASKEYVVEWSKLRDLQEERLKSGVRSKEMNTKINPNSAQQLAHKFFTNPVYRNKKVNLYIEPATGKIEPYLSSEIPAEGLKFLSTLIDPYIEWGQSECENEQELEEAFNVWIRHGFEDWFNNLLSIIDS